MHIGAGRFLLGDCFEHMATLPDASVDMVLCDLPYGTTACAWDAVLPFEALWKEYWRVAKPNAAVVLTASQPFTAALIGSQIANFKYCWVWEKSRPSGFAQAKNMPLKNYEDICIFSRGVTGHASQCANRMPYNPQNLVHAPRITKNTKIRGKNESAFGNRPSHKTEYTQEYTNYPSQILRVASISGAVHPTQKPVALFEYLIRTYTDAGQVVLDNTAGSGTTAIAAERAGRGWICIERDPEYYAKAVERVRAHLDDVAARLL